MTIPYTVSVAIGSIERMARATNPRLYRVAWAVKGRAATGWVGGVFSLGKAQEIARRANLMDCTKEHWVERIEG